MTARSKKKKPPAIEPGAMQKQMLLGISTGWRSQQLLKYSCLCQKFPQISGVTLIAGDNIGDFFACGVSDCALSVHAIPSFLMAFVTHHHHITTYGCNLLAKRQRLTTIGCKSFPNVMLKVLTMGRPLCHRIQNNTRAPTGGNRQGLKNGVQTRTELAPLILPE